MSPLPSLTKGLGSLQDSSTLVRQSSLRQFNLNFHQLNVHVPHIAMIAWYFALLRITYGRFWHSFNIRLGFHIMSQEWHTYLLVLLLHERHARISRHQLYIDNTPAQKIRYMHTKTRTSLTTSTVKAIMFPDDYNWLHFIAVIACATVPV